MADDETPTAERVFRKKIYRPRVYPYDYTPGLQPAKKRPADWGQRGKKPRTPDTTPMTTIVPPEVEPKDRWE